MLFVLAALGGLFTPGPGRAVEEIATRLEVESLIPLGEGRDRWMIPPGGHASTDKFLCTVQFDAGPAGIDRDEVEIVQAIPQGLAYVPGTATGPGTRIELSVDDAASFLPVGDLDEQAAAVTHIRWVLTGPLAPGLRGRVSFRVELERSPSPSVANQ